MREAIALINAFERVLIGLGLAPEEAETVIKHGFVALVASMRSEPNAPANTPVFFDGEDRSGEAP